MLLRSTAFVFTACVLFIASVHASDCADPNGCGEITRFDVSPTTVMVNGTLNATWASRGMWECFGTHFPNTAWSVYPARTWLPAGSLSFNVGPINPGVYTLRIECRNGALFDDAFVSIRVVPEP